MTIKKMHFLLKEKKISSLELTKECLKKINENSLNTFITINRKNALDQAERIDQKIANNEALDIIEGIPMSLMDNFSTKGIKTTGGSKMLEDYVPVFDATVWDKIQQDGAILLGKTNMDEFAMASSSKTSYFGSVQNPYHPECVAGGAAGGGAAAVASGQGFYALGTDAGGSIRKPAAFCGITGFKPTYGLISRYGVIPFASSFDQIGILASTPEDVASVFDTINFSDEKDQTCLKRDRMKVSPTLENPLKGVKIGHCKSFFNHLQSEVEKQTLEAFEIYKKLGAEIVDVTFPNFQEVVPIYSILACAEASSNMARFDGIRYGFQTDQYENLNDMIVKNRSLSLGEEVKRNILFGTLVLSAGYYENYYQKALKARGRLIKQLNDMFEKCDILLMPTTTETAYAKEEKTTSTQDFQKDILTIPANIGGLPAVTIPFGRDENGLPIGIQLMGNKFREDQILNAAHLFYQETREESL